MQIINDTYIAVEHFGPTIVGLGRTVIAAVIVSIVLLIGKGKLPTAKLFKGLIIVAFGAVHVVLFYFHKKTGSLREPVRTLLIIV